MADRPSLSVQERPERGSRESRRLRRDGFVPGVLYGASHPDPVSLKVGVLELRRLLAEGAALFDVKIGSDRSVPVILKDRQDHPVRGDVMHVDFLEVRLETTDAADDRLLTVRSVGPAWPPRADALRRVLAPWTV